LMAVRLAVVRTRFREEAILGIRLSLAKEPGPIARAGALVNKSRE
jgi:hypothetical protein